MLSMSTPEQGFTQVRQGSKIQKYPWHWRSEHVWTEYLPQRIMVMPWQNTAMVSIRWRYLYVVLLRFDAVGTHSTCVEVWQQLDEHSIIHESTIGQVCQFANTLGFGTQVFWVVAHSWRFHVVDGLPKHDKTSWLFRRGFKSLISIALLARVHKSPLHKVVASGLSCISHKLSTVRTCVKWWLLHSIKQMKHVKSQS